MRLGGLPPTRSWTLRSTTGWVWPWRSATRRSPIFRCATRSSTCRTAGTTCEAPMLKELLARVRQGYRTLPYPASEPVLPDRFKGKPELDPAACAPDCRACAEACPTGAIAFEGG